VPLVLLILQLQVAPLGLFLRNSGEVMMVTSPGPNTIVCKQLQPSHGTSLLDISVADVANMDAVA